MALVVATARIPAPVGEILGPEVAYDEPPARFDRSQLRERLAGADALISTLDVAVDRDLLEAAPKLRVVANFAVGYDNVDVAAASERGILVCNTPDVLTETTADMAFALLLAVARRIVEGDHLVREGRWQGWAPDHHLGLMVSGKTLGIVGLGRIGAAVARRARGFGMTILYSGPRPSARAVELGATRVGEDELWARSDFISLHCPARPETHHLVDATSLAAMRPHAVLVNTARGAIVDEGALAEALAAGRLGGAGLDVFEREPEVEPRLLDCPRVVLAPHAGSATTETRRSMGETCARAVRSVLDGELPATAINPEARPEASA